MLSTGLVSIAMLVAKRQKNRISYASRNCNEFSKRLVARSPQNSHRQIRKQSNWHNIKFRRSSQGYVSSRCISRIHAVICSASLPWMGPPPLFGIFCFARQIFARRAFATPTSGSRSNTSCYTLYRTRVSLTSHFEPTIVFRLERLWQ